MDTITKLAWATCVVVLAGCSSPPPPDATAAPAPVERAATDGELAALRARRARVAADRDAVSGLAITDVRAYRREGRRFLDVTLVNQGALDIARFSVRLTLTSDDRADPWLHQEFSVPVVDGPLLPGARHSTTMTPTHDSPWGMSLAPDEATMRVELMSVTTTSGEVFHAAGTFDDVDARKLAGLEGKAP